MIAFEGRRLPGRQHLHQVYLGISNIPDCKVADAICRFARDVYFECLDLFTTLVAIRPVGLNQKMFGKFVSDAEILRLRADRIEALSKVRRSLQV